MVNACPREGDPRISVEMFVKNHDVRSIAGLREEGIEGLAEVVISEIRRQCQTDNNIVVDRNSLCGVYFPKDLTAHLEKVLIKEKMNNLVFSEELSMIGWQHSFLPLIEEGFKIQVYFTSLACRQVPVCSKMF